jgi:hypothetical protein
VLHVYTFFSVSQASEGHIESYVEAPTDERCHLSTMKLEQRDDVNHCDSLPEDEATV